VPEQSVFQQVSEGANAFFVKFPNKKGVSDLTVLKGASAGAHLWRERRLLQPNIFLSDELQAEIVRRGSRIPRHHRLKAI